MEKVFGKFQRLPRFPGKIVLYLSSKFYIFAPFTSIQSLGFLYISEQF